MSDVQAVPVKVVQHGGEMTQWEEEAPQLPATPPNPLFQAHALLRGRYHWAIGLGVLLAAAGTYLGYRLPPLKYQSTGLIRIQPNKQRILYQNEDNSVMPMFDSFIESQVDVIKSQRVLDYAMQNPDWQHLGRGMSPKVVAKFRDAVEVVHPSHSELIEISFTDSDANVAMVGARAVMSAYQKLYGENDADNPAHALQVLEERRTALTNQLQGLNERILGIATEFGTDSLDPIYTYKLDELKQIESERQQAQLLLASTDARSEAPGSGAATQPATAPLLTAEEIAPFDKELQKMLDEQRVQQDSLRKLENRYGSKFPAVIDAKGTLAVLNEQIAHRVDLFARSADSAAHPASAATAAPSPVAASGVPTIASIRLRKANLDEMWAKAHDELLNTGRKNLRIKDLRSQADDVRKDLADTTARIEHLNIESSAGSRFVVVSDGDLPLEPYKDKRLAAAGGGAFGGMALGIGAILALGLVNRKFRSLADAEAVAHSARLLGVLPELPSQITTPEEAAAAAHCLHHIRTALQIHRQSRDERVYAITSPAPGAGKTSTVLALGLSFAAAKSRTLLIDCDIVGGGLTARLKKTCHRKLGQILTREGLLTEEQLAKALPIAQKYRKRLGEVLVKLGWLTQADIEHALTVQSQSQLGLLDVLGGEPLAECSIGSGIPGLFVLPLGGAAAEHVGQLSPEALRAIIQAAREEYDTVLIDTGPLLGSLEASIVSTETDKVVLVVSKGQSQAQTQKAMAQLESMGARLAGIVFNRATFQEVEHSGFSSTRVARSASERPALAVRTMSADRGMHVGPIGSAVATSTAAHHHDEQGESHE